MSEYFDYSNFPEISPEIIEKQKLRRSANACGLGLIALFGVMYFWSLAYLKIITVLGIPTKQAITFISDPLFSQVIGIVVSAIMVVVPFFIVAKSMGVKISSDISFKKAEKGLFLPCLLLGIGICLFSSFAVAFGGQLFTVFGIEFPSPETIFPKGVFGVIVAIFSTAFFPAFLEELALRGFVLGFLRRFGNALAIISSAAVFGIMHANADQIVFAFLVGLILGFITVKTESIWCAIAVHFTNNLISVILSYFSGEELLSSMLLVFIFTVLLIGAIWGITALQKTKPDFFKIEENTQISTVKKIRWFFTSPAIISSFIISLLIAYFVR